MSRAEQQPSQPLRGKSIFLAVESGPETAESRVEAEALQENVLSLARAVFSRGGTLLLAQVDPVLPLILVVAAEYWQHMIGDENEEATREPFVRLYATTDDEDLRWWRDLGFLRLGDAQRSTYDAIAEMIENEEPLAMICLGGVGGVARQAGVFREIGRNRPIFTIAATGGDAGELGANEAIPEDHKLRAQLARVRAEAHFPEQREPSGLAQQQEDAALVPFPLCLQRLVDRLTGEH